MHSDLGAALDRAEADTAIRAVVITGAGRGFCAGADLAEFDFAPGPDLVERANPGPVIDQAFNPTARRLVNLRMPTICRCQRRGRRRRRLVGNGRGDIAIARPVASFIQAFSKIGLIPDAAAPGSSRKRLGWRAPWRWR